MTELSEYIGRLKKIVWTAEGEGSRFCILSLQDGSSAKGECNPADLTVGCDYRFYGKLGQASKWGPTFEFKQLIQLAPHNREGVIQYLIKHAAGVGPVIAARMWDLYGSDAVMILRTDPQRVYAEIPGSHLAKLIQGAELLKAKVKTEATRIDLATLFEGGHFPSSLVDWCIEKFGIEAGQRIRRDPFTLIVNRAPGCGFDRVDALYNRLGLPKARLKRQLMCLLRAIQEDRSGHVWHPIAMAEASIKAKVGNEPTGRVNWVRAVKLGVRAKWLKMRRDDREPGSRQWFFALADLAECEEQLAEHIDRLMSAEPVAEWPNPDGIKSLTEHQKEALHDMLCGPVAILCGTPGTGKTTTAAALIKALIHAGRIPKSLVAVVAPTGKASVRIQASLLNCGLEVECSTVHRLLGPDRNGHDGGGWNFHFNERNKLPYQLIVVDEVSMMGLKLSNSLFQAIPDGCLVLLVGDPYQLPPVDEGAPLRDFLAAGVPNVELTEILRNSGTITQMCRDIRNGIALRPPRPLNLTNGDNWLHIESKSDNFGREKVKALIETAGGKTFGRSKPIDATDDTQVLVALNDQGLLCRSKINDVLQPVLNPHGEACEGNKFRVGDKVICTSNCNLIMVNEHGQKLTVDGPEDPKTVFDDDEEKPAYLVDFVANGEIGRVAKVDKKSMVVRFDFPKRNVFFPMGGKSGESSGGFQLAPAITFHKSQGSQWPIVVCLIDRAASRMASRELWYTGISRAETIIVTIGELNVLNRQCQRVSLKDRKTFLVEQIREKLHLTRTRQETEFEQVGADNDV